MGALERMLVVMNWILALAACIVVASCSDGSADAVVADTDALSAPDLLEVYDAPADDVLATSDADEAESQDGGDTFASDVDLEHDLSDITEDEVIVADEGGGTDVGPECDGSPKEGCPCDKATDKPCCLWQSVGLACQKFINPTAYYWQPFGDCGCDPGPWCEGYPLYPLCK